jgi:hypothetical protein
VASNEVQKRSTRERSHASRGRMRGLQAINSRSRWGVAALIAGVAAVGLLPSASWGATDVSPGVFNEVSTGIGLITTYGCGGLPIAKGSGFLVGDSVVMTA